MNDDEKLQDFIKILECRKQEIVDTVNSYQEKIDSIHLGKDWMNVSQVILKKDTIYMIRRNHNGKPYDPGLHRWTKDGWEFIVGEKINYESFTMKVVGNSPRNMMYNAKLTGREPQN